MRMWCLETPCLWCLETPCRPANPTPLASPAPHLQPKLSQHMHTCTKHSQPVAALIACIVCCPPSPHSGATTCRPHNHRNPTPLASPCSSPARPKLSQHRHTCTEYSQPVAVLCPLALAIVSANIFCNTLSIMSQSWGEGGAGQAHLSATSTEKC